jgi:hypothetical protein
MKLSRQKREELASAAILHSLAIIAGCSVLFALTAFAADPSWWSSPGSGTQGAVVAQQVVTNDGIVSTNYITNNYAVVVQGQLKQFTARAVDELNSNLTGGAGSNLNNLVHGWAQDYATNNYSDPTNAYAPYNPRDFTVMTAGQLKYVGNMVWTQLVAGGYTNALPAWLDTNSSDNQLANVGQLKQVFDFDLSSTEAVNTITDLAATLNGDGSVTLSWSISGSGGGSVVIGGLDANGNWDTVETLSSMTTTVNLTASQIGGFSELGASNALANALALMAAGALPNPSYVSLRYAVIDLTTNYFPSKITDSGYVLTVNRVTQVGAVWSAGNWLNLNLSSSTLAAQPTDIGEDGTVVGEASDVAMSESLYFGYGFFGTPLSLAIWPSGTGTNTLVDPPLKSQIGSFMGSGGSPQITDTPTVYPGGSTGWGSGIFISPNNIWGIEIVTPGGGMIDGFHSSRDGSLPIETGSMTDGGANGYGNAVFPLSANNSDMCLQETDYNYQYNTNNYFFLPTSTSYSVGNIAMPGLSIPAGLSPLFGHGVLSNTNSLGGFYVLASNAALTNGASFQVTPTQYYCWDGTNTITLPQPPGSTGVAAAPNAVNAATTLLASGSSNITVPATQVVGGGTYGYIWSMVPSTNAPRTFGNPQVLDSLLPGYGTTNAVWSKTSPNSINDLGAITGTSVDTNNITHGVVLIPLALTNLADPYQGMTNGGIQNPAHNNQNTPIDLVSTNNSPDIKSVAWIAASDPNNGGAPRMPHLQASIAAPNGTTVWWKLSVVFHGQNSPTNNYRDFDPSAILTSTNIYQLTNSAETGSVGYSDDITVPITNNSADTAAKGNAGGWLATPDGWVTNAAGTPWNIYQDNDWQTNAARGFFGGDSVLSVKITGTNGTPVIVPEQDYYFRIAGENPTTNACEAYIQQTYNGGQPTSQPQRWTNVGYVYGPNPPTVPGYWFAYAIAKEETATDGGHTWYNNFMNNGGQLLSKTSAWPGHEGRPDWNNDDSITSTNYGTGGYGLFQLTFQGATPPPDSSPAEADFIMPRGWIWNWQTNVTQFLPIMQSKMLLAQSYINSATNTFGASFTNPSSLTVTKDGTNYNYWEASAITRNNGGYGWYVHATNSPTIWGTYHPASPTRGYLYKVTHIGINNNIP